MTLLLIFVPIEVCRPLQDPMNGKVYILGNKAVFGCFNGTTVMGNHAITCINGNWDSPPPTCKLQNS